MFFDIVIWYFRNFAQVFSRKIYQLNVSISIANFLFFNRLTVSRHLANTRVAWPVLRETRHFSSLITRIRLIQKDIRYIIRNIRLNGYSKHLIGSSLFFPLESWKRKGFLWGAYEVSENWSFFSCFNINILNLAIVSCGCNHSFLIEF